MTALKRIEEIMSGQYSNELNIFANILNGALATGPEPIIHPGGFISFPVDKDRRLELHMWTEDLKSESLIHDHPYTFRNFVLLGGLSHDGFRLNRNPNGDHSVSYVNASPEDTDQLMSHKGYLEPCLSANLNSGEHIPIERRMLHRTSPRSHGMTATLIKKFDDYDLVDKLGQATRIVLPEKVSLSAEYFARQKISRGEVAKNLDRLYGRINQETVEEALNFIGTYANECARSSA